MTSQMYFFFAYAAFTLFIGNKAQNQYCNIATCPQPTANTLCQFDAITWGPACQSADQAASVVSDEDKEIILSVHNNFRRQVALGNEPRGVDGPQPPASNMRRLIWDDEVALMAQTHAQQCVFQHDECRDITRFQVGQNLYLTMDGTNTFDWTTVVQTWYDEVQFMTNAQVASSDIFNAPGPVGHYTQLVWANTATVGCGVSIFESQIGGVVKFYVCNYGPAGNFFNQPVYLQGVPGAACPSGTVNVNGLCA